MNKLFLLAVPLMLIASCAPSYNPQTATPDAELSCADISQQLVKSSTIRTEAQGNKGLSAQNVGWALLFWPAIFINESNNSQTIQKIDDRVDTLNRLYTAKNCKAATTTPTTTAPAPDTSTPAPAGK